MLKRSAACPIASPSAELLLAAPSSQRIALILAGGILILVVIGICLQSMATAPSSTIGACRRLTRSSSGIATARLCPMILAVVSTLLEHDKPVYYVDAGNSYLPGLLDVLLENFSADATAVSGVTIYKLSLDTEKLK